MKILLQKFLDKKPNKKKQFHAEKRAGILIPIISQNSPKVPQILYTVRNFKMRSHAGEVSFPGGMFDPKFDKSLQDTAVRETLEEVNGIKRDQIEIIGQLPAYPDKSGTVSVVPYVGFFTNFPSDSLPHQRLEAELSSNMSSRSLDYDRIQGLWNDSEVADVFLHSINNLLNKNDFKVTKTLRYIPKLKENPGSESSHKQKELIQKMVYMPSWRGPPIPKYVWPKESEFVLDKHKIENVISSPGEIDRYRIWGLSAFFTYQFLRMISQK